MIGLNQRVAEYIIEHHLFKDFDKIAYSPVFKKFTEAGFKYPDTEELRAEFVPKQIDTREGVTRLMRQAGLLGDD